MITEWHIALRLVAAAVLGGLVDMERERHNSKDVENNQVEVEAITKVASQQNTDKLISRLSHIEGIQAFEIQ